MVTLVLPIPPSVNNLFINLRGRGRARSQNYKDWLEDAGFYLMQQTWQKVSGPFTLEIKVPRKLKGDISNRIKAVEDLLVSIGATDDDSLAQRVSIERADVEDCELTARAA